MSSTWVDSNNDPLSALVNQNTSGQRAQLAQYAIMQAAGHMQNKQNDQAILSFKKALALDPQNATAYNYLGQLYLSQGKNADSIKAYQQLVRIQSNPSTADTSTNAPSMAATHISLGNAYLQDKQYSSSEKEFKAASKLDPHNPLPVYTLGLQYANTNRLSEAVTQFQNVKKISPKDGNVYYALGMVYNKLGRYEDAAANLEKSQTLKKNFPSANYELGIAYNALGRSDDAHTQLSILQGSDPAQATNLQFILEKPQIVFMDQGKSRNFNLILGPATPLWMLDPSLLAPKSSSQISVAIQFNNKMDAASIMNPANWDISKAKDANGGYYIAQTGGSDVAIPAKPNLVSYNPLTQQASVTFTIQQNAAGNATIDPTHLVFKFSGKDASGRSMDTSADQIDGAVTAPY